MSVSVAAENTAANRSRYVHADEIDGYYPVAATLDRASGVDANIAPSGIVYTPGSKPYVRLINTAGSMQRIEGTVTFIFVRSDVLSAN